MSWQQVITKLISDPKTGDISLSEIMVVGSFLVSSMVVLDCTFTHSLSEYVYIGYLAVWAVHSQVTRLVTLQQAKKTMMTSPIEWLFFLFFKYWRSAVLIGLLASAVASGYFAGYNKAQVQYQYKLERQQSAFNLEKAQATAVALSKETAANEKAVRLSYALAKAQRQLAKQEQSRHEQINQAVSQDGIGFSGIGPHSVQLYKQALGYPNADRHALPSTASQSTASAANAGLSPVAILKHANSYGAWCLGMREQLIELNKLYGVRDGRN